MKQKIIKSFLTLAIIFSAFVALGSNLTYATTKTDPALAPADWAFEESSIPLHDALLERYPDIDTNGDGYISITEANNYKRDTLFLAPENAGVIGGTLYGIEHFTSLTNGIFLTELGLSGSIPENIGNMGTNITTIKLEHNNLTGPIPQSLYSLTGLTVLTLHDNQLSGELSSTIGNLNKMKTLTLHNNQLTGVLPSEIGSMTELGTLLLYNNQFSGAIPASFTQLTKLTSFYIQLNNLNLNAVDTTDIAIVDGLSKEAMALAKADLKSFPPNEGTLSTWESKVANAQNLVATRTTAEDKTYGLFNSEQDNLVVGITQAQIDEAQAAVNLVLDGSTAKVNLQQKLDLAQQMFNAKLEVKALLSEDKTALNPGVDQDQIDEAQKAVDKLPVGTLKDELQKDIDTAQDLLNAQNKVGDLLNEDKTALNPGVDQDQINEAQKAVDKLPEGTIKDELQKDIDTAQEILDKTLEGEVYDRLDTTKANALLAKVNRVDSTKYTKESYAKLSEPKAEVEAIIAREEIKFVRIANPSQAELDAAVARLQAAYDSLEQLEGELAVATDTIDKGSLTVQNNTLATGDQTNRSIVYALLFSSFVALGFLMIRRKVK